MALRTSRVLLLLFIAAPLLLAEVFAAAAAQGSASAEADGSELRRLHQQVAAARRDARLAAGQARQLRASSEAMIGQLQRNAAVLESQASQLQELTSGQRALQESLRTGAAADAQSLAALRDESALGQRWLMALLLVVAAIAAAAALAWRSARASAGELLVVARSGGAERLAAESRQAEALKDMLELLRSLVAKAPAADEQDGSRHELPIKVADEVHRMQKRLQGLPEATKGLVSLRKSLERLIDELKARGYEIVDHVGLPYSENWAVKAAFVPGEDLPPGSRIVSKVVVPQVNHGGRLVRMAEIEVSVA